MAAPVGDAEAEALAAVAEAELAPEPEPDAVLEAGTPVATTEDPEAEDLAEADVEEAVEAAAALV